MNRTLSFRSNVLVARRAWGKLSRTELQSLRELTTQYRLSVCGGDIQLLDGRWYVTHTGLLKIAERRRCAGIKTLVQRDLSTPASGRWVFKATVYKSSGSIGFVGYGEADPSTVSPLVRGAEMRVAETRAVNRALRKAYGIGLCSVEELGYLTARPDPAGGRKTAQPRGNGAHSGNGHTRLRDRLCLLIREHQLDPTLVKLYAADFCGIQELREASRELIESFVTHLSQSATQDRAALICKLNSYAQPQEAHQ